MYTLIAKIIATVVGVELATYGVKKGKEAYDRRVISNALAPKVTHMSDYNGWEYDPPVRAALTAPKVTIIPALPAATSQEAVNPLMTDLEIAQAGMDRGAEALIATVQAMVEQGKRDAEEKEAVKVLKALKAQEKKIDKATESYIENFLQKVDLACADGTQKAANS